jgi:tRNA(Ile)-lysidine synthase TilS/MesJ
LIRGTGPQGLVAMQEYQDGVLRPWLQISRLELEKYLQEKQQNFMQDPTHDDLRSWMRLQWLPELEERNPGAMSCLARSLENICSEIEHSHFPEVIAVSEGEFLSRQDYWALSVERQRSSIARYMLGLGVRDYTRGQIQEIQKNLDKNQIEHTFIVGSLFWSVNAKQIWAKKVSS